MTISSEKDNISTALSELRQMLDDEKERLNEEAAQAMKDGEYDTATAVIEYTKRLLGFQSEVEVLIGKWDEFDGIGDLETPQDRRVIRTRVIQSKNTARLPRTQRMNYAGITKATAHCFHILDVLEQMGGVAKNQDVSTAVNKRIKMLYPQFKQAKVLMAERGWTQKNGSIHVLEISGNGSRWLQKQKTQLTGESHSEHIPPSSASESRHTPPKDDMPVNGATGFVTKVSADEDFEQI